ncbi:MAG: response regulator transcription factor [Phycisphaeraceae bacterium]|nr:response regulator transcription factor [Phycisphaeraceae bacterium]
MRQQQDTVQQEQDTVAKTVKVLVVARQGVLQQALVELINYHKDFEVVSLLEDMHEANRWLQRGNAHVLIMDWPLSDVWELNLIGEMIARHSGLVFLAVSLYDDPYLVKQALGLGVKGYVSKAMAAELMCTALQAVYEGRQFCSPDVVDMLPDSFLENIEIGSQG